MDENINKYMFSINVFDDLYVEIVIFKNVIYVLIQYFYLLYKNDMFRNDISKEN